MNWFINSGGVKAIEDRLGNEFNPITSVALAALLRPLKQPSKYLDEAGRLALNDVCSRGIEFVKVQDLAALKGKEHDALSEVVKILKLLARPEQRRDLDQHRMAAAEQLLSTNKTFNGKMNALKEVHLLCKDLHFHAVPDDDQWLTPQLMLEWLHDRQIIDVALQEFLHIEAYVRRIEEIVQFLLHHDGLTEAGLTAIWNAQNGQHGTVVRNIYNLVSKLAFEFNREQQQQLLACFKKSWSEATDAKTRSELLDFIKQLAKDSREAQLANDALEMLWDLSHDATVALGTTQLALDAHIDILTSFYYNAVNAPDKVFWIERFMGDLNNPAFVVPALIQVWMSRISPENSCLIIFVGRYCFHVLWHD